MQAGNGGKSGVHSIVRGFVPMLMLALGGCAVVPAGPPVAVYRPPVTVVAPPPVYPSYALAYVAPPVVVRPPVVLYGGWHRGWGGWHHGWHR